MAWLIVCPSHRTGLFGLIFFFVVLYYQPNLHANYNKGVGKAEPYNPVSLTSISDTTESPNAFTNNGYFSSTFSYIYHPTTIQLELSHVFTFFIFFGAILYVCTFLPFGRFYNRVGGNATMLYAYLYIFIYLSVPEVKKLFVPLYIPGLKARIISSIAQKSSRNPVGE